jgi:hypothetical protein
MKQVSLFFLCLIMKLYGWSQQTILSHPESVNSDGRFLYVSNVGKALDPTAKDGDGFISKLSMDRKMITQNISKEKLNAPKGSAIINGVLYVADIDRIVGIALSSGKKTTELSLSTSFANDVAAKDDNTLFVSATDVGKIFEVNLKTGEVKTVADVKGANGIVYDKASRKLYTCSFMFDNLQGGEIGVIDEGKYEVFDGIKGAFDGLALIDAHTLIVSDWGAMDKPAGFLQKIDLRTKTVTKFDWPLIGGPADFYCDGKQVYIPAMVEGKVAIKGI